MSCGALGMNRAVNLWVRDKEIIQRLWLFCAYLGGAGCVPVQL